MSLFYLLYFAAIGQYAPYWYVYFHGLGLSGSQIGVLSAVAPVVALVAQPVWGIVADRQRHQGRLLLALLTGGAVSFWLLGRASSFVLLVGGMLLFSIFSTPISPLADALALAESSTTGRHYSRFRLWGSPAYGVTSIVFGALYAHWGYGWVFPLTAVVFLLTALVNARHLSGLQAPRTARPTLQDVGRLLRSRQLVALLAAVLFLQAALAIYNTFFGIYLGELAWPKQWIGVFWGLPTVLELLIFYYLDRLTRRFGPRPLLATGMALFALRFVVMAFWHQPLLVLLVQMLHGPSFALYYASAVVMVAEFAPPALRVTGQSLFGFVTGGLGNIAGSLLGGRVADAISVSGAFGLAAALAVLAMLGVALLGAQASGAGHQRADPLAGP